MNIGITGASGFLGQRVAALAGDYQHACTGFSRNAKQPINGCTETRAFSTDAVDSSGLDAVVHLAGESVLGLWTHSKRRRIMDSRVHGTRAVIEGIRRASSPPRTLVSASAIGYYGDTGDAVVDESSPPGDSGFLAEVAQAWEEEARKAEDLGCRVVLLRIGFVVGPTGGAIQAIKPVFKLGLGGNHGSGKQWMSLVHADDVAGMALWAINADIDGPINACLPEPVRNAEFTRQVASLLRKPAFLHTPAFALKSTLGKLSTLMLDSHRILPKRPLQYGYSFRFPTPAAALADSLQGA